MSVSARVASRGAGGFALACAGLIVAAGAASAAPHPLADRFESTVTADGWELQLAKTGEVVNQVPNLATSLVSREGFVSVNANARITGQSDTGIDAGIFEMGYQVGCAVDVSSGVAIGLGFSIGPSVGVTVSGTGPGAKADLSASVSPDISTTLLPGAITDVPFVSKDLSQERVAASVKNAHIKVDGCGGPVTIRSYAIISTTSPTSDDTLAVYGDAIWL